MPIPVAVTLKQYYVSCFQTCWAEVRATASLWVYAQRVGNLQRSRRLHTSTRMSFIDSTFCFFFFPFLWSLCSARKPSNLDRRVGRDRDCDRETERRKDRGRKTEQKEAVGHLKRKTNKQTWQGWCQVRTLLCRRPQADCADYWWALFPCWRRASLTVVPLLVFV